MPSFDTVWINTTLLTMTDNGKPYGLIEDGAIAAKDGKIAWVGQRQQLTATPAKETVDCAGSYLSPGFIDCHTHIVYGGHRIAEFEQRLQGLSYSEIAQHGGGILSTVRSTRAAPEAELVSSATQRLSHFMREGVTTLEIKSGYGLDTQSEIKMLRVVKSLAARHPVDIAATFLGAHTIPPEYKSKVDDYIDLICDEMLPAIAADKLASCVDAYCETIAFSTQQISRVFKSAQTLGLHVKLHADQLSNGHGAELAAQFNALSADHLEYTSDKGVHAMAAAGTVAVLLPGAFYMLKEKKLPPIASFRKAGVPMAIASDCNPGTSPILSLRLIMNMACILFGMTPEEALSGVTRNAAKALGLQAKIGTLETGKQADLVLWEIQHPAELSYSAGGNVCLDIYKNGKKSIV